jgi:hypothetical protein
MDLRINFLKSSWKNKTERLEFPPIFVVFDKSINQICEYVKKLTYMLTISNRNEK